MFSPAGELRKACPVPRYGGLPGERVSFLSRCIGLGKSLPTEREFHLLASLGFGPCFAGSRMGHTREWVVSCRWLFTAKLHGNGHTIEFPILRAKIADEQSSRTCAGGDL